MNTIFYYSGTGNSLYVARTIGDMTKVAIRPLLNIKDQNFDGQVGLVFPIYMNKIPRPVETFIRNNDFSKVAYLYAISTHMGLPGQTEYYLDKVLRENSCQLDDYFDLKMINNTPKGVAPKPLMSLNWEEGITEDKIKAMQEEVDSKLPGICSHIQSQKRSFSSGVASGSLKSKVTNRLLWKIKSQPKLDFILDDTCTGCGICEKVCLSNRIKVSDQASWIHHKCYYCYACFNFCPEQAISVKHYEKKLGRYHHPDITSEDIANQK